MVQAYQDNQVSSGGSDPSSHRIGAAEVNVFVMPGRAKSSVQIAHGANMDGYWGYNVLVILGDDSKFPRLLNFQRRVISTVFNTLRREIEYFDRWTTVPLLGRSVDRDKMLALLRKIAEDLATEVKRTQHLDTERNSVTIAW